MAAPGLPDTSFAAPEGMVWIIGIEPSPDGQMVAIAGWGDYSTDSLAIFVMSLADGSTRRIASLAAEGVEPPRWLTDGTLVIPVFETRWTTALYRIPIEGGPPVRLGIVPRFPGSYRFSADGRRGIIRVNEANQDVHVVRNFAELAGE
jgi:Tol biopolymer transport system component